MSALTPDLAEQVLAANHRNLVKKIADGGTLTATEAAVFENVTISPERARLTRAQALLAKWSEAVRLTKEEEAELETFYPGTIKSQKPAPSVAPAPSSAPPLVLEAVPVIKQSYSNERLSELSAAMNAEVEVRTMRRWIKTGKLAGDPCPIESPNLLKKWWAKHMKHAVPAWLLRAADNAPAIENPVTEKSDAPVEVAPPVAVVEGSPLNLDAFELGEGEAVKQQRSLVALLWSELKKAYTTPGADSDLLQSKYNKATEALRKLEKDDRDERKAKGLLIPRSVVQRDVETACELIRQMSETEKRRVLELCPTLGPEQRAEVAAAIDRVCEVRTRVFRNLKSLKSNDDAVLQFTAA